MEVVQSASVFPMVCVCGASISDWWLDTLLVRGRPAERIYFCSTCVDAMLRVTDAGRVPVGERDAALADAAQARAQVAAIEEERRQALVDWCPVEQRDDALEQLRVTRGQLTRLREKGAEALLEERDSALRKQADAELLLAQQTEEIREAQKLRKQLAAARAENENLRAHNGALQSAVATLEAEKVGVH